MIIPFRDPKEDYEKILRAPWKVIWFIWTFSILVWPKWWAGDLVKVYYWMLGL